MGIALIPLFVTGRCTIHHTSLSGTDCRSRPDVNSVSHRAQRLGHAEGRHIGLQGFTEVCACHIGIVCQECQLPQCCVHLCGASGSACSFHMARFASKMHNALHHHLHSRQHCTWQARVQIPQFLNCSPQEFTALRKHPPWVIRKIGQVRLKRILWLSENLMSRPRKAILIERNLLTSALPISAFASRDISLRAAA